MDAPRPAQGASRALLEELLQAVRRELVRREEAPSGDWVEESARDLATGAKPGWFYPKSDGDGIAFYARRTHEAYGHVHAGAGPEQLDRGLRLASTLLESLPVDVRTVNLGFTGLEGEEEARFVGRLAERPGSTVIERLSMDRSLSGADGDARVPPPPGVRLVPVREVTLDALAELDRRAFDGTVDELLVGPRVEEYRFILDSILEGRLGRFVDEASVALVEPDPPRLVGAVLTSEQSIRRAVMVDLMVDPERRRRGVGRFLVTWVLRALWALGYESIRLWVTEANRPARELYAGFGFCQVGRSTIYRWDRPGPPSQAQSDR
jgi:ribosomal protein S18 acetylase RimI-like enzyme